MKKTVFLMAVVLSSVLLTSCEKDYTKPENLSGTVWKAYGMGVDYVMLVFTSENKVEYWVKEYGYQAERWVTYSYSIFLNQIRLEYQGEIDYTGTIENGIIFLTIEDEVATFIKQ